VIKNRMKSEPIPVVRQHREVRVRNFTTAKPGRTTPIAAFGLLRGDSCSGRLSIGIQMHETKEVLYNRVHARVNVWFIPKVAMERFERNKTFFERSAVGEPTTNAPGAPTIPYFKDMVFNTPAIPVFKHLGLTAKQGDLVNADYLESYNCLVNHSYRQRSKALPQFSATNTSLAPSLWNSTSLSEIVPDFDDAMIAGEVPLSVVNPYSRVYGLGMYDQNGEPVAQTVQNPDGGPISQTGYKVLGASSATTAGTAKLHIKTGADGANPGKYAPDIYAKLTDENMMISLANFDQAKKLVEWAKLREQYEGHKDPWIIDTLMRGLPIDDQAWFMPMLIDSQMVDIEQIMRMATDYENMEEGVANGVANLSVGVNIPENPYGGVVMVTFDAIPEQFYERQADPYFTTRNFDELPRYDRDVMNPMPVVEVKNWQIDTMHTDPQGRFGYARRNWHWANVGARAGGDLYAPNADAQTAAERLAIWPTEVANPTLNQQFMVSTTLGRQVFVDQVKDPFRIGVGGKCDVMGLTVIGEVHESEANYEAVRAEYLPLVSPRT